MTTPTTERNRHKDSQGLNSHHVIVRAVNSLHLEEEIEIANEKLQLRKDFRNKKKNKKNHQRKQKVVIKPHSSPILGDFVDKLKSLDSSFATELVEEIIFACALKARDSNLQKFLIIMVKVLKLHLGVSYSNMISKVLLNKDMSFIKGMLSWKLEDIEIYMKELLNNWKLAHKNEAFGSLVALVSTFLSIFYSAEKKWSISVGSFSMFLFDAKNACKGATSFVDALLKVSTYVIGGLKKFVGSGSYSGFLYSDDQLGELDSMVSTLQAQFKFVKPGNLGKFTGLDENAFDQQLQLAIESGKKLILLYDGPTKKFVMDKVRMLRQLHCDFIQTRAAGGLRVAPFAYLLAGSTGLGKSSINEILMRYILSINGFNHQDPYIVTLNSQDKFYSTYRSYINGVIFDDFANVNRNYTEESPCETLLKFVNNVPFYLNMAELDLKGNVVAEPKVVGITTNVCDIDSSYYSNQASSIMRRMKVHIYAKVKPEFRKEGTIEIDPSKVQAIFGEDVLAPDIWFFDVYVVKVCAVARPPKLNSNSAEEHRDDKWHLQYVQWNGSDMANVTINELLAYVKDATKQHFIEQNALVERSKLFGGDITCDKCSCFFQHCTCVLESSGAGIHQLNGIIGEMENAILYDPIEESELSVNPHSAPSFYPELVEERKRSNEQSLKDMLFAWIVEGRCNADAAYNEFVASCSKELQYVLVVFRRIAEKWFIQYRKSMIEMCFPLELEGTCAGDYYSIVMRSDEVNRIAFLSCGVETVLRGWALATSICMHSNPSWYSDLKYIVPFASHYMIQRMKIADFIVTIYAEGRYGLFVLNKVVEKANYNKYPLFVFCLLVYFIVHGPEFLQNYLQVAILAFMAFVPFFWTGKDKFAIDAPRALSLFYKDQKEQKLNDWSKIVPAAFTLSTLYCSKSDLVDFYVDACEKWYTQPQSRLKPSSSEVENRDHKYKFDDEWFRTSAAPFLDPLPTSVFRTPSEVRDAVGENVWFIHNLDTGSKSNCFVVCSGCVLIPYHFVPKKSSTFRIIRHNRGNKGNKCFEALVEPSQCVQVKNYDLAMVWMPKTRDVRSMIDFFPVDFNETCDHRVGRIVTRDINGDLEWSDVRELSFTNRSTSGLGYVFPGIRYIWNWAKEGKCLSPIISDDKQACISGLHIGGSTKSREDGGYIAFGVTPTQRDIRETKMQLEKFSTVIPMSSSGDFGTNCMGVEVLRRDIKKKSCYLRMEFDNSAIFLGSSTNCNRTPKTQVRDTPIKDSVMSQFGVTQEWGSPKFKGPDGKSPHMPWEEGMKKWIVNKPGLPFDLLNKAKIDYSNSLTRVIYKEKDFWSKEIRVLDWDETVNGIPGKRFIDSMNFQSSIGFPFSGSKKLFSTNLGKMDGWQDKRVLDPKFILEAEAIEECYRSGKRYYPWFTSTLKDEPTLTTKDKVRVFQATSTPFQLVMRKYTLSICRFLQMNPLVSECAVGIDPCSNEWNEMFQHLKEAQTPFQDRWFAIDYKAYDTSIPSQMIMAIGRVYIDIAKIVGYSEMDITVLNSIFSELAFSVVDFNGDVLMLDGANPSGNSLTVFINSLCNSMLMRVYFYHLYPRRKFANYVKMMSYGDDLIASIGSLAGSYTMKGYALYLNKFGFVVTPAQKEEELKNFSKLCEIDFLKRKFVWSADYASMIAPLEEASIFKRLCNYMSSETSVEVIVGANIDGALDEWAFYGKTVYLDRQKKLIKIVEEFGLHRFIHRLYMTYEQRVSLWKQNNADPAVMGKGQSMVTGSSNCDSEGSGFFGWGRIISKMGIGGPPHSHNSGSISSDDHLSINKRTNNTTINQNYTNGIVEANKPLALGELDLQSFDIKPHSAFMKEKEQVLSLVDGSANQVVDIPSFFDETRMANDSSDNSLGAFFLRPIKIGNFNWSSTLSPSVTIEPWSAYLSNKRVVNKIATYKLLRGTMKIKILINGNSFYYGRLMASYWPLSSVDLDTMTLTSDTNGYAVIQFSQMPRIFLDPTTSQGGEMTLPFFWHNDYLDILSTDPTKMGTLAITELVPLKHAAGAVGVSSKVSVTIYAWMENVQLEAPTTTNPAYLIPQADGARSAVSLEQRISDMNLGSIQPHSSNIAPYSKGDTIEMSSKMVPVVTQYFEPKGMSTSCLTNVSDTTNKMTLTAEQSVSIDPRIVGLSSQDELDIAYIAGKETYLTRFLWQSDAAFDELLWNIRVTPAHYGKSGPLSTDPYYLTAPCGAVLPFKYWNGTFKLRLQISASAFHRGRLAIVYDPHKTSASREDNVTYSQIVDISTCRDVTFSVGPNQDRTLLSYAVPGQAEGLTADLHSTVPLNHFDTGNGTIAVYVVNELVTSLPGADANTDIYIAAFVSMGEDFQAFIPSGNSGRFIIRPQSTSDEVIGSTPEIDQVQVSETYDSTELSLDQYNSPSSHRLDVYAGERITSFRQLLKRYHIWAGFTTEGSATIQKMLQITHKAFPAYKGYVPGAVHTAVGGPYNYFGVTMLNYFAPAFQGWRGSIRYKLINKCQGGGNRSNGMYSVSERFSAGYSVSTANLELSSESAVARSTLAPFNIVRNKGSIIGSQAINPVIEYEIPWFENFRFCPGKVSNWTTGSSRDLPDKGATLQIDSFSSAANVYEAHVAAGEDFNFYFFTGWPPMYYSDAFPLLI